ncbi:MAG TPA: hypothetical protein VFP34_00955 [Microlunatus sp.]|nr:hypothetical protein [Microlunatus sp.]
MLAIRTARAAAVVTWAYVGGFGGFALPVAVYLSRKDRLPTFLGLFQMYGGRWSAELSKAEFTSRLVAFTGLTALTGWSAWLLWQADSDRRRAEGAVLNLALLPVEAVFWVGFALPIPWLCGASRLGLLAASWLSASSFSRSKGRTP